MHVLSQVVHAGVSRLSLRAEFVVISRSELLAYPSTSSVPGRVIELERQGIE